MSEENPLHQTDAQHIRMFTAVAINNVRDLCAKCALTESTDNRANIVWQYQLAKVIAATANARLRQAEAQLLECFEVDRSQPGATAYNVHPNLSCIIKVGRPRNILDAHRLLGHIARLGGPEAYEKARTESMKESKAPVSIEVVVSA